MEDDGLLHTAELLKTALPYVDVKSRFTLELLVKLYELIICVRNYKVNDIVACDHKDEKADMETLLNSIRPKCNENERTFVDMMLNIFQAKRMFEMYNTYMETMKTMQGFEGFGGSDTDGANPGGFMSNFKDLDLASIFGNNFNSNEPTDNNWTPDNDIVNEPIDSNTEEDNNSSSMFENLKGMIPPDQMETFENLRMLFGSMSYDDNNKSDENEV